MQRALKANSKRGNCYKILEYMATQVLSLASNSNAHSGPRFNCAESNRKWGFYGHHPAVGDGPATDNALFGHIWSLSVLSALLDKAQAEKTKK